MTKIKIAPSILSADFAALGQAAEDAARWGADYIHCDVMDGRYVPNITFGMGMVEALKKRTSLPLDVHLMIVEPEKYVERFAKAGADLITFHPDASVHAHRTLQQIKAAGAKCGVVLNPGQGVKHYGFLYEECDMVLVMSVNPGYGGQRFIPSAVRKIEELAQFRDRLGLTFEIEVDGGINEQTAREVIDAGATILVAGNAVFSSSDPAATIAALRCGR